MKQRILVIFFVLIGTALQAQKGFKIGIQGGIPIGDFNDRVGVVIGAEVGYVWPLGEVIDLGVTAGFLNGFPEKYREETVANDFPNVQFIPLGVALRIWPSNSFFIGGDIGQALGINEGNDGGLFYRPQLGFLMGPQTQLNFSYTGVTLDEAQWATITMGVRYTIAPKKNY